MTVPTIGTVTTDPTTFEGGQLINRLTDDYIVAVDQVHDDGQVNFVLYKDQ